MTFASKLLFVSCNRLWRHTVCIVVYVGGWVGLLKKIRTQSVQKYNYGTVLDKLEMIFYTFLSCSYWTLLETYCLPPSSSLLFLFLSLPQVMTELQKKLFFYQHHQEEEKEVHIRSVEQVRIPHRSIRVLPYIQYHVTTHQLYYNIT